MPPRRLLSTLAAIAALGAPALLAGCSHDPPPVEQSGPRTADVAALVQRTLSARAASLREGDRARFRRTLARTDRAFLAEQQVYYDNLATLPLGELAFEVLPETIVPAADPGDPDNPDGSGDYWAEVLTTVRLQGYDAAAVRTRDRFRFTPTPDGRRLVVASTTDADWEQANPGNAQPWDLGPIEVLERAGVLGIFDDSTRRDAGRVLDAVAAGRSEVRDVLGPGAAGDAAGNSAADGAGVVVYALTDPTFLHGLADQTVGDADRADGLSIVVPSDARDPDAPVAAYRIFLNPRVLAQPDGVLGRLVRHELTHVALRGRGLGAPLWLSEGIAEYVSVQAVDRSRRGVNDDALRVAASAVDLPGAAEFAGPDATGWYAVSWWVCEYVAGNHGEQALLMLLDRTATGTGTDAALREVLGLSSRELVQRGVALLQATYGA
ncbi:hypothetical protein JK386_11790 [Nocardioides sp. zg-536]|uniref:Peptidase MA-like domain-containing protein n=1 Tax=Nocardioides faecalis TaxID=2803858 RepID=A0A939BWH7_9ACTN|nr:hypothetical protein [Nocardioides faecalis]MBM9460587.1 hypothetical protein [Nocardioides faecalis]QVI57487.1 hypothetical protein KG111_10280 [Nocardioides faecalis]